MIRTAILVSVTTLSGLLAQSEPTPAGTSEPKNVEELVALMRKRQQAVHSVELKMVSTGRFAGGAECRIEGTIRVLGKTHFHIQTVAHFDPDVQAEEETVVRPDGAWMREREPAFGEVFTKIDPELLAELNAASALLGGGAQTPGGVGKAKDPLGAGMVESLDEHFALALEKRRIKGVDYYVLKGDRREPAPDSIGGMPTPDHVEILVRTSDLAVMQMVQLRGGKELTRIQIEKLVINPKLDPASFKIDLPEGKQFIDAMDYPPSATHINQLLSEYENKRNEMEKEKEKDGSGKSEGAPESGNGKSGKGNGESGKGK